jgi:hypothetical protein
MRFLLLFLFGRTILRVGIREMPQRWLTIIISRKNPWQAEKPNFYTQGNGRWGISRF